MAKPRQLKSGMWQARIYENGDYKSLGTFKTKTEARQVTRLAQADLDKGTKLIDRKITFGEVATRYLKYKKSRSAKKTHINISSELDNHILPTFKNKTIASIDREDIEDWLDDLLDKDLMTNTNRKILTTFKAVLNYAVHDLEVIQKSPAYRITAPAADDKNGEIEVKHYTVEELDALLAKLKDYQNRRYKSYQPYHMAVLLMSESGLRVSEALGLPWDNIETNTLTVNGQLTVDGKAIDDLKTKSSYRTITIGDDVVDALKEFKREQNKLLLMQKFIKSPHNSIFQQSHGGFTTPGNLRHVLRSVCEEYGLEYKGTHCFRHSHAVHLMEAGATLKHVSMRLGHASISITGDIYAAVTKRIEQEELTRYEAYKKSN